MVCALLASSCGGQSTDAARGRAGTERAVRHRVCTVVWVGPRQGEFGTARDWSTGRVPGRNDVACAARSVTLTVDRGHYVVSALIAGGNLKVSGGYLSLHDNCTDSELGNVHLSGGVLDVGKCASGRSIDYCTPYSPRLPHWHCVNPGSTGRDRS